LPGIALNVSTAVAMTCTQAAMDDCRPETWFHVIGGNLSQEGLAADIEAIAAAGIGGLHFFHGDFGGPWPGVKEQIPCRSAKWEEMVGFAADACARHGIAFKMQNCPGWSMSGGPWIDLDHCMRKLVCFEPGREPKWDRDDDFRKIGEVTFPCDADDGLVRSVTVRMPQMVTHDWAYEPDVTVTLTAGTRTIFRRRYRPDAWTGNLTTTTWSTEPFSTNGVTCRFDVASSHPCNTIEPMFSTARRLDCWEAKAGWRLGDFEMSTNAAPIAFTGRKTLVFGHVNAKETNHPAPPEGTGWECDKLDAAGFIANWNGYLGKLLRGPLAGGRLKGTLVDSWECGNPTWTPKMEAEFRRLNGYELRPWLPAIFGYVLKSEAETEKFLLDWRRTISTLIEENYYGTIARLAQENGMTVQYETAFGDVVAGDVMRYWKYADEPMCEFWSPFDNDEGFVYSHAFKPVGPCVSAAHVYGKRRVSAEAFTSFKLTFDENMQEWKENANRHFARGVTHIVFHTFTHNPQVNGLPPGTSFGGGETGIGSPFTRLQTWWPYMREFTGYLTACGRELEAGKPVVDILRYLGDKYAHRPSECDDLFDNEYKCDYLNHDALMTRVAVKDGRLVFPDGTRYRVLWIPAGTFLLEKTRARLAALRQDGARIVYGDLKPDWAPQLRGGDVFWYERRQGAAFTYFIAAKERGFRGKVWLRDLGEEVWLDLARGESRFIRTGEARPPRDGRRVRRIPLTTWSRTIGPWKDLPGTDEEKAFSGTRTYVARVDVPAGGEAELDLGRVRDWATVAVNGQVVSRLWCEPYRCDITPFVKPGHNEIRIDVTSTWYNRLVYDAGLPAEKRKTWTYNGPGKDALLHDSGLMGPVSLLMRPAR